MIILFVMRLAWVALFALASSMCLAQGLPVLNVNRCHTPLVWNTTASTSEQPFALSDCSGGPVQGTRVNACYDNLFLRLHFTATDDNPFNPYTNCNDPLYQYSTRKSPSSPF